MIELIATATEGVWPYLVIAIGSILAFFGYGVKKKHEGEQEAKADQLEANHKAGKEAKKRYEENLDSDNDDIASGL